MSKIQISNVTIILLVGAELLHSGKERETNDEADSRFFTIVFKRRLKLDSSASQPLPCKILSRLRKTKRFRSVAFRSLCLSAYQGFKAFPKLHVQSLI